MKSLSLFLLAPFFMGAASCSAAPKAAVSSVSWPGWIKMPLLSPAAKTAGVSPGGEGGQWPRGPVVVSRSNPNFLLLPIDVGGVYRSLDGGAHWNIAMNGWSARGANGFAIDPRNASHVLGAAANGNDWGATWGRSPHGLYLSSDGAASWKPVLRVLDAFSGAIIFDPSSYDAKSKVCTRAYYLSNGHGLFRSDDGGATWAGSANTDATKGGFLRADDKGALFIGGAQGLWRSDDRGVNWTQLRPGAVAGLDVGRDGTLWVSGDDKIAVSRDGGKTFSILPCNGVVQNGKPIQQVTVSPADPKRMLCWVQGDNYAWIRYVSQDGGQTFSPIAINNAGSVLPFNVRQGYFAWHPTDPNIVYGLGGDWVTRSVDGGKTFSWWNNGNNGIMLGASFNFLAQEPKTVSLGFQDYDSAFTLDGGQTWNYRDASGEGWGGFDYGAGQTTGGVMWLGDAESWTAKRHLRLSRDGGKTWNDAKDAAGANCVWDGADVSLTDPKNDAILFASNWRSPDKGASWAKMNDCDGVYIAAPDGTLLGKRGEALVTSSDHGASWKTLVQVPGGFGDVAFDAKRSRYYFASQDHLKTWQNGVFADVALPKDQMGNPMRVQTVAVDVGAPDVVYTGGPRNIYASAATVARSRDGGKTWENLSTGDGPHEVAWIRVQPATGEAWLNGQCYGMWRIKRPAKLGQADPTHGDAPLMLDAPSAEVIQAQAPAPKVAAGELTYVARDFGAGNFDYVYGSWKMDNLQRGEGFVTMDVDEGGGAGAVLNGANLSPSGQTLFAIRLRLLPGNKATQLRVNLNRSDADGGGKSLSFDLTKANEHDFVTLTQPLPDGKWNNVQQIQLQGTNFSPAAQPLKIQVAQIGTTSVAAVQVASSDPTGGFTPKGNNAKAG